jgi:formate dehydrogenase maturation protein FdhE
MKSKVEVKDNTALFKRRKEEIAETSEVCRVCGSKDVHSTVYDKPTMGCIHFFRVEVQKLENGLASLNRLVGRK